MEAARATATRKRSSGPLYAPQSKKLTPPVSENAVPPRAIVRVSTVELSLNVSVQYELSIQNEGAPARHARVRVQFPDEVRAMLETTTWSSGATILESIVGLGTAYLNRLDAAGLITQNDDGRTFHLPLSDLRAGITATSSKGQ